MSWELAFRLIGMVGITILGARFGIQSADRPERTELFAIIFGLLGSITGLIITPYLTTRPTRYVRQLITAAPAETLVLTMIGLIVGLGMAALFSVPLSQLPAPWGQWLPSVVTLILGYAMVIAFSTRSNDIGVMLERIGRGGREGINGSQTVGRASATQILLDTSVIIDGRVLDISKAGFLLGTLVIPRFVLNELQHIADSPDALKRQRGRRGLDVLEKLQKESPAPVRVIDIDIEGVREVDDKLVLLARQINAQLMTNDFNLNGIAKLQGVPVMNINDLANAVKAMFLPNEKLTLTVIQEGKEANQGVGYLPDGTMVVVEDGRRLIDRTVEVVVIRMIQTAAGKMYFAKPL
jgi:uncharacterized protein YacL